MFEQTINNHIRLQACSDSPNYEKQTMSANGR